jgi:hypothetical protein
MLFTISIHDYMLQHVGIMLGRLDVFNYITGYRPFPVYFRPDLFVSD